MAGKASITKNDFVLDAGCGVGGSSIWIAKNLGTKVTGITLSDKQVEKARSLAEKNKVSVLVNFQLMDFLKTSFKNESFDVVWGIESVSSAENKLDFFKEAFRVLKKGGRLVIADGLLMRKPESAKEEKIVTDFTRGWVLPNLDLPEKFQTDLKLAGFNNIKFWDTTKEILPSAKRIFWLCTITYPFVKILETLRLTSPILTLNHRAGMVQYEAVKTGLGGYGVFYAEK